MLFTDKKVARNARHLGMYLDNKLEQSRPARQQAIKSFLFPYALAAVTWIGILAYFSINSLDLPKWHLIPSFVIFIMYDLVRSFHTS